MVSAASSQAGSGAIPLPPLSELLESAHVVSIATRTRFRGVTEREAVIFAGPKRWSEFSPFIEYGPQEASQWLRAAIEFGWGDLPAIHTPKIAVNGTIPAVSAAEVEPILSRFSGVQTVKVKVAEKGQVLADDIARVARVREIGGSAMKIRIDANAGWSLEEAQHALEQLERFDLDYVEQPVATIAELAALRGSTGIKIAADESVRKASDPLAVAKAKAADLLVVKAQPLGGISRALEIISQAQLPVVVSSALDTSVGISMGAHLAAALPSGMLYGACGLGTVALLDGDVTADSLAAERGAIPVTEVVADERLLTKYAAGAERKAFWFERIAKSYDFLTAVD